MKSALLVHLGLVEYGAAWKLQRRLVAARKADAIPDVFLLCEHPHVITLGRNGKLANLRAPGDLLRQMGVSFFETDRGGDITYHGPGQLVGYPILNLAGIRRDVGWYIRGLEEAMMRATAEFGIVSKRVTGRTGVWVDIKKENNDPAKPGEINEEEKLSAIGVHLSRWVTSHGFAYNVSTDLRYFDLIVPCGIAGKRATSLEKLLGRRVEMTEVSRRIATNIEDTFGLEMRASGRDSLEALLQPFEDQATLAVGQSS